MRERNGGLSSLLIRFVFFVSAGFLSRAARANTLHYEAPLHEASWQAQGSPLVCRLSPEIGFYGIAEFVRYAGRQMYLSVNVDQGGPRHGKARLRARPAAWQHGLAEQNLGAVAYRGGRDPFRLSRKRLKRILAWMEQGCGPAWNSNMGTAGIGVVLWS